MPAATRCRARHGGYLALLLLAAPAAFAANHAPAGAATAAAGAATRRGTSAVAPAAQAPAGELSSTADCASIDARGVARLFDEWNLALSTLDADKVVQRYWADAVLLPTVSNTPRTDASMIRDYFEHFLLKRPRGRIDTRTVEIGCNVALDVGTYTFALMSDSGQQSEVAARYTFVYEFRDGAWRILHHHSSAMPETSGAGAAAAPPANAAAREPASDAPAPLGAARVLPSASVRSDARSDRTTAVARDGAATSRDPAPPTSTKMFVNMPASPPIVQFYPPASRKRGEQGVARLRVCAAPDGSIAGAPSLLRSSGSDLLDEAARTWVHAARWVPATLNRQSVEGCTEVDVRFDLELCKRDSRCPA